MPELPEVETVKNALSKAICKYYHGNRIVR